MSSAPDPATAQQSRAWVTITVASVMLCLATVSVVLRTYTRAVLIKQFGVDDAAALFTLLLALGCGAAVLTNVKYGLGRHIWTLDNPTVLPYFRTFYVSIVMYNATLMSVKMTFLLQYYRVFTVRKMRKVILVAMVIIGCWSLSQLLVAIFNCNPIPRFWDMSLKGTCIPNLPFWYINAAGNIATDVAIFVLPIPVLGSLQLRRPQKLLLIAIFSLGFFTCAISIIRIQYLHLSNDASWDNINSSSWSVTEMSTAIICACLPTLRPLVSRVMPTLMGSWPGKSSNNNKYYYHKHSSGREPPNSFPSSSGGGRDRDLEAKGSVDRTSNSASSQQGVLYAEELELQRADSADLSDHIMGLEDSRRALPGSSSQGAYARGLASYQSRSTPPKMKNSVEKLGLAPSVKTEVKVGTPKATWEDGVDSARYIAVQRDIVLTQSDLTR
ncbi:hypothetical protein VTK73DRAFT_1122 [Phialemonium thermophilum]|uniref:Rhodopsin domain-containing protein n=1 Tax=Phialemonium thermophilum TaxID=223376 RepID=A0ABR3VTX6_9PEZI